MASKLPPAPVGDEPVTVPLDVLPEWLDAHGLEIIGFDERGYYVREKGMEVHGGREDEHDDVG